MRCPVCNSFKKFETRENIGFFKKGKYSLMREECLNCGYRKTVKFPLEIGEVREVKK